MQSAVAFICVCDLQGGPWKLAASLMACIRFVKTRSTAKKKGQRKIEKNQPNEIIDQEKDNYFVTNILP